MHSTSIAGVSPSRIKAFLVAAAEAKTPATASRRPTLTPSPPPLSMAHNTRPVHDDALSWACRPGRPGRAGRPHRARGANASVISVFSPWACRPGRTAHAGGARVTLLSFVSLITLASRRPAGAGDGAGIAWRAWRAWRAGRAGRSVRAARAARAARSGWARRAGWAARGWRAGRAGRAGTDAPFVGAVVRIRTAAAKRQASTEDEDFDSHHVDSCAGAPGKLAALADAAADSSYDSGTRLAAGPSLVGSASGTYMSADMSFSILDRGEPTSLPPQTSHRSDIPES